MSTIMKRWCLLSAAAALVGARTLPVRHEPFAALEHVNLNVGDEWTPELESFFLSVLRCTSDPRARAILNRTNDARDDDAPAMGDLRWINVGLQQFHLPINDNLGGPSVQSLRGDVALAWPRDKLPGLRRRLEAWLDDYGGGMDVGEAESLSFVGPNDMRFEIEASDSGDWFGPVARFDAARDAPPGGPSEGLGIRAVRLDVPKGTAAKICRFYAEIFEADVELSSKTHRRRERQTCVLFVGFHQSLEFRETDAALPYEGAHVALYVNFKKFVSAYYRARHLVFHNPRSPQFSFDTIDDVLSHDEFRFKDIIDLDTGDTVYELEHEIRALSHQGFTLKHRLPGDDNDDDDDNDNETTGAHYEDHPTTTTTTLQVNTNGNAEREEQQNTLLLLHHHHHHHHHENPVSTTFSL